MKTILAWHFLREGFITGEGRKRVFIGETLSESPPLRMCSHGLHASRKIGDALRYAPGSVLTLCECSGEIQEQNDKLVCQRHRALWGADISKELYTFACDCAQAALCLAEVEDPRCWEAVEAKLAFLRGEISAQELDDARAAAWAAAGDAAGDAAWDAAWDAARAAAWAAARDAARDAAWDAARDAAGAALLEYVKDLMPPEIRTRVEHEMT